MTVGTYGRLLARSRAVVAMKFIWPPVIGDWNPSKYSNATSTSPRKTAFARAGVVLYGTIVTSRSAIVRNSSAERFCALPALMVPKFIVPGWALALAITSLIVL